MSTETNHENPPVPPATTPPSAPATDLVPANLPKPAPGMISVMCPVGITPYALEGMGRHTPLFARVSYRPE